MNLNRLLPRRAWVPALLAASVAAILPDARAQSGPSDPSSAVAPQARVIVIYKPEASVMRAVPLQAGGDRSELHSRVQRRADQLARTARVPLTAGRAISERAHVVTASGLSSAELARRLSADPSVASAEVDGRKRVFAPPNDPLYTSGPAINLSTQRGGPSAGQWYAKAPTTEIRSAVNAEAAWARGTGTGVVVAVLDTGVYRTHADLSNRLLAGYDFITRTDVANDGSARDNDATDPGDYLTDAEVNNASGGFYGGSPDFCSTLDSATGRYRAVSSSWHGTKVAGIIAAESGNSLGIVGLAHGARVLPVRVLGKCGGFDSDIQAGMRWAAGLSVPGVPTNTTPAKILNMSLGSDGACSTSYRDTVAEITAAGAVVIAAAGNSNGKAVGTPANCAGVIGVAGLRHAGTKVGFSDLGPEIAIAAPGGNCVNTRAGTACLYPIVTSTNAGTTSPVTSSSPYTDAFDISVGTSFAAPIVSATAALMLSVQPGLRPSEIKSLLQSSARPFPSSGADNGPDDPTPVTQCQAPGSAEQLQCYCTTALCGAGMLDADAATAAALQVLAARITVTPSAPVAGSAISLSSASSLAGSGRRIVRWEWAITTGGGIASAFSGATNAATASVVPSGAGSFSVRLTVFDDLGRSASSESTITVATAPVTPPADTGSSSSSGGGTTSLAWLLSLTLASLLLRRWVRLSEAAARAHSRRSPRG